MRQPLGHQAGAVVGDGRSHAVVRTWTGRKALCGAGRIAVVLHGRFDATAAVACPDCAERVRVEETPPPA